MTPKGMANKFWQYTCRKQKKIKETSSLYLNEVIRMLDRLQQKQENDTEQS